MRRSETFRMQFGRHSLAPSGERAFDILWKKSQGAHVHVIACGGHVFFGDCSAKTAEPSWNSAAPTQIRSQAIRSWSTHAYI